MICSLGGSNRTDPAKKGRSVLRQGIGLKYAFMTKHRSVRPLAMMCQALGVSGSRYYAWCKRRMSHRARRDAQVLAAIRRSFAESDATYRVRRVWLDLNSRSMDCARAQI